MAKVNEKQFNEIANSEKQVKATSANVDMSQVETQSAKELTESERLNAFMALHAVEHYCAALGADENEVRGILEETATANGANFVFTCPKFDKTHTREEWLKSYPNAISLGDLGGNEWFKRSFIIGDARGVKTVVNSFNRYDYEKKNANKRQDKKAENGLDALVNIASGDAEMLELISKLRAMKAEKAK